MESPFTRFAVLLARLARVRKPAEFRLLLELAARSDHLPVTFSAREMARRTGLSLSSVILARRSLEADGLIRRVADSRAAAASFELPFLAALVPAGRVSNFGTPPPETGTEMYGVYRNSEHRKSIHPVSKFGTPPDAESMSSGDRSKERAPARVENFSNDSEILDRILHSSSQKHDDALRRRAQEWLHSYMIRFGNRGAHPPDSAIVTQFLAVAPWEQLANLLLGLTRKQVPAGASYAWFIAVALEKIHNLSFEQLQARRRELPKPPGRDPIHQQFDDLVQRKAMR